MENIQHIFENFYQYLIIGLFITLFFKESMLSFINAKLGIKDRVPEWSNKMHAEMERLSEYTNHSTTTKLDTLLVMHERYLKMEEEEHVKFEQLRESLLGLSRDLREIKEYGIKIRKDV